MICQPTIEEKFNDFFHFGHAGGWGLRMRRVALGYWPHDSRHKASWHGIKDPGLYWDIGLMIQGIKPPGMALSVWGFGPRV
jgi:hypothetical protein